MNLPCWTSKLHLLHKHQGCTHGSHSPEAECRAKVKSQAQHLQQHGQESKLARRFRDKCRQNVKQNAEVYRKQRTGTRCNSQYHSLAIESDNLRQFSNLDKASPKMSALPGGKRPTSEADGVSNKLKTVSTNGNSRVIIDDASTACQQVVDNQKSHTLVNNLSNFDTSFYMEKSEKMLQPQVKRRAENVSISEQSLSKPMTQNQKARTKTRSNNPERHDHGNPLRHSQNASVKDNAKAQRKIEELMQNISKAKKIIQARKLNSTVKVDKDLLDLHQYQEQQLAKLKYIKNFRIE